MSTPSLAYHENRALLGIQHASYVDREFQLFGLPPRGTASSRRRSYLWIKTRNSTRLRKIPGMGALAHIWTTILDALAYALKIALNSTYGLTAAKFDNPT